MSGEEETITREEKLSTGVSRSFYTFLPQHSKYIKLNFSDSAEKISLISFFSFELELKLTKMYPTSLPPLFSGFCSVYNKYCK